jgi:hypothetical protein
LPASVCGLPSPGTVRCGEDMYCSGISNTGERSKANNYLWLHVAEIFQAAHIPWQRSLDKFEDATAERIYELIIVSGRFTLDRSRC